MKLWASLGVSCACIGVVTGLSLPVGAQQLTVTHSGKTIRFEPSGPKKDAKKDEKKVDLKVEAVVGINRVNRRPKPGFKLDLAELRNADSAFVLPVNENLILPVEANYPAKQVSNNGSPAAELARRAKQVFHIYYAPAPLMELPSADNGLIAPRSGTPLDPFKSPERLVEIGLVGVERDPQHPTVFYLFYDELAPIAKGHPRPKQGRFYVGVTVVSKLSAAPATEGGRVVEASFSESIDDQLARADTVLLYEKDFGFPETRSTTADSPVSVAQTSVELLPPGAARAFPNSTGTVSGPFLSPPNGTAPRLFPDGPTPEKATLRQAKLSNLVLGHVHLLPRWRTDAVLDLTLSEKNRDPNSLIGLEVTPLQRNLLPVSPEASQYTVARQDEGLIWSPTIGIKTSQRLFAQNSQDWDKSGQLILSPFGLRTSLPISKLEFVKRRVAGASPLKFSIAPYEWRREWFGYQYSAGQRRTGQPVWIPTAALSLEWESPVRLGLLAKTDGKVRIRYKNIRFLQNRNTLFRNALEDNLIVPVDLPQLSSNAGFLEASVRFNSNLGIAALGSGKDIEIGYRAGFLTTAGYFNLNATPQYQIFFGFAP